MSCNHRIPIERSMISKPRGSIGGARQDGNPRELRSRPHSRARAGAEAEVPESSGASLANRPGFPFYSMRLNSHWMWRKMVEFLSLHQFVGRAAHPVAWDHFEKVPWSCAAGPQPERTIRVAARAIDDSRLAWWGQVCSAGLAANSRLPNASFARTPLLCWDCASQPDQQPVSLSDGPDR